MISVIIFGRVELVQLLWTFIAIIGFSFASVNLFASNKVVQRLKKNTRKVDEVELRVSTSLRTTEFLRVLIQTIHVFIGALSFTIPASHIHGLPLKYQILGFAFRWGLVASATLTTMQSINLFRLRKFFAERGEDGGK